MFFCLKVFLESKTYEEDQTPLHYAAKKGNNETVVSLINDYNADKECKDYQRRTPLYLAAEHGKFNKFDCSIFEYS